MNVSRQRHSLRERQIQIIERKIRDLQARLRESRRQRLADPVLLPLP